MAESWPNALHIQPAAYHGGASFNGPACHKLLKNIDKLELLAQLHNGFEVQMWIEAFRSFNKVVHGCFGTHLSDDFAESIAQFQRSCEVLPISITPKMHIVFHHVREFIESQGHSLGLYSEK